MGRGSMKKYLFFLMVSLLSFSSSHLLAESKVSKKLKCYTKHFDRRIMSFQVLFYHGNQDARRYMSGGFFNSSYLFINQKREGDKVKDTFIKLRSTYNNPTPYINLIYSQSDLRANSKSFTVTKEEANSDPQIYSDCEIKKIEVIDGLTLLSGAD